MREQNLNLAGGAVEERVERRVVDCFVALLLLGLVGRDRDGGVHWRRERVGDLLAELGRKVRPEQVRDAHVCGRGIDEREERGRVAITGREALSVERVRGLRGRLPKDVRQGVVLDVLDPRETERGVNAGRLEDVRAADTVVHKHVQATDRPAGQDDLLVVVDSLAVGGRTRSPLDTSRSEVRLVGGAEDDAGHGRVGEDGQVRARGKGVDVRGPRVRTRPVGRAVR